MSRSTMMSKAWLDALRKAAKEGDEDAKKCLDALEGDDADEPKKDEEKASAEKQRLLASRPDLSATKAVELFRAPLEVVRWAVKDLPRGGAQREEASPDDAALEAQIDRAMGVNRIKVAGVVQRGNLLQFGHMTSAQAAARLAEIEAAEAAEVES